MSDLSLALHNFYSDLENQGLADKVIIMTTSEFGRRPYQNGGGGTDHGAASPMFILGNNVNGGIIGNAPNLSSFDNNNNLLHEYDYRQIYSSLLNQHFGLSSDSINNALLTSFDNLDIIPTSNSNLGDVNFDNQINVVDIVIMVNFILGITAPTNEEFIAADLNEDSELNVIDVVANISNILGTRNNPSSLSLKSIGINQKDKLINIPKTNELAGIEIHFKNKCMILNSKIDDNWTIRNHENKVILYSNDLKSMSKTFSIKFDRYSKVDKIIVSNKNGSLMKSRIYKK
jgi:hypothetical protein